MRTSSIRSSARVLSARAAIPHERDPVKSSIAAEWQIHSIEFIPVKIHALNSSLFPIGPEEMSAGVGDVKRVRRLGEDGASVGGVVRVHAVHALELGVGDAEEVRFVEDGQSVGQTEVLVEEHAPVGAVHVGDFDLRPVPVPVGPEDPSVGRIGDDAARIDQLAGDDHFALASVQFRHFDAIQLRVRPVHVSEGKKKRREKFGGKESRDSSVLLS